MTETEDARLTLARAVFAPYREVAGEIAHPAARAGLALLDFAEERLRVNVGLLQENETLKRRLSAPESDQNALGPPATLRDLSEALSGALEAVNQALEAQAETREST